MFKVYNSSMREKESLVFLKGPDVFSWAAHQRITHDHGYCRPEHVEPHTPIDHGTVHMKNVHWYVGVMECVCVCVCESVCVCVCVCVCELSECECACM